MNPSDRNVTLLREAHGRMGSLLANLPDLIAQFDGEGRLLYVSPSVAREFGAPAEYFVGKSLLELDLPGAQQAMERWHESILAAYRDRVPNSLEASWTTPYGESFREIRNIPEREESGRITSVIGIARDVTDRKRSEDALARQKRMNEAMFSQAISCFVLMGRNHRIIQVNEAFAAYHGKKPSEFVGRDILEITSAGESPAEAEALIAQLIQTKTAVRVEARPYLFPDQPERGVSYWDWILQPILDERGEVEFLFFSSRDVTERTRVEEALKKREQELFALLDNAPDPIARYDGACRFSYVNVACQQMLGSSADGLLGKTPMDVYPSDEGVRNFQGKLQHVLKTGETLEFENRVGVLGDGSASWHQVRMAVERDRVGQIVAVLCITRDITGLKETERQFRALAENSPDVVCRINRDGRYLYVNRAMEKAAGAPASTILGRRFGEAITAQSESLITPEILAVRDKIQGVVETGVPAETELKVNWPHGAHYFNIRLLPERETSGRVVSVLLVGRDVTERKRFEEALLWRTAFFEAQVDSNLDGILVVDREGKKLLQNRRMSELWKIPPDIAGDPDDAKQIQFVTSRTRHPQQFAEKIVYLYAHPDEVSRDEIELVDGMILDRYSAPVRDKSGQHYGRIWTFRDITERRQLEEQFRQSQKMEAIGQLAGGIAHDFNNLLSVIQMQASLMLEEPGRDQASQNDIQEIMAASQRAAGLTRQLLTFSRREVKQAKDIHLGEVIAAMSNLLQRVLGEDIVFEKRIAARLPLINADSGMMEQILLNLAVNARDAMPGGGRLTVALTALSVAADRAALHPGADAGQHVCLAVSDSGCGIAAENLSRIFEPFFTTKEVGKGTGLGLSTVFGIAQQHRGWVEVESEVGVGTTFRIFLPAIKTTRVEAKASTPLSPVRTGSELVLVVEDEPVVRSLTQSVLKRYGYQVVATESAVKALEISDAVLATVSLLLTDLVMPGGTTGQQLAERLVLRKPDLKVLYTSGYSDEIVSRQLKLDSGRTLLRKPFLARDLAMAVRHILDGSPDRDSPPG